MSINLLQEDCEFLLLEEAKIAPPGLIQHYENKFWCVHPQKGLAFYNKKHSKKYYDTVLGAPLCNSNEAITRGFLPKWAFMIFIPQVFVDVDPSIFRD